MTNDMNAFELSDEQLAEVTGAGDIVISPQIAINNNVQINTAIAPTTAVVISVGGSAGLKLDGAHLDLGNSGLLGNLNSIGYK